MIWSKNIYLKRLMYASKVNNAYYECIQIGDT